MAQPAQTKLAAHAPKQISGLPQQIPAALVVAVEQVSMAAAAAVAGRTVDQPAAMVVTPLAVLVEMDGAAAAAAHQIAEPVQMAAAVAPLMAVPVAPGLPVLVA
jgi:hypothetical protein